MLGTKKWLIRQAIVFAVSIGLCTLFSIMHGSLLAVAAYIVITLSIVLCFSVILALLQKKAAKVHRHVNSYALFAIVDLTIMALVGAFSLWDITAHKENFLGGLLGAVLLYGYVPVVVGLLICDVLVFVVQKILQKRRGA